MHESSPPIVLDDFLSDVTGVIHVGANSGQERDTYATKGLSVLWVEALPNIFAELKANISSLPKQAAVQALVTDRPGVRHTFHVANNSGASSSIFDFTLGKDIWPEIYFTHDLELESKTLDQIIETGKYEASSFDALVMDTQGSEVLVLKGATRTLKHIRYIKSEAADFEAYAGCATVDDLKNFLSARGFQLIKQEAFAVRAAGGKYYELLFKKRTPLISRFMNWFRWRG